MFIHRKQYLTKIPRIRVAEGRDLENGLRLDRNERVEPWPIKTMSEIFADKPGWFLSVYPESGALYRKLAKFHGVDEAEVLLTAGIDGGLKTLCEVVTEPGDVVGVVSPTYAMYRVYAQLFRLELEEIDYTPKREFDFAKFDAFMDRDPTIFFLPNPNQPIESCFEMPELEEFAKETLARNCLFVIDEAYHMFGGPTAVELVRKYENVVIARTFSKGFGVPSIRLGYLISTSDNISILSKMRLAHESNALSNAVAEHLLDNYPQIEKYNAEVVASRERIKRVLAELKVEAHGNAGNFLLLDMGDNDRAKAYAAQLRSQTIYVKGPWAQPWDRFVTITVGPIEAMQRFIDATRTFCVNA